jgi:PKD repeat protein
VDFVIQGCAERTATSCAGLAPLRLTFVPIDVTPDVIASWDLGDGSEPREGLAVTHTFDRPGVYSVTLTLSRGLGTESERKDDFVLVRAAPPGGPCRETESCARGSCTCIEGECQPALAEGLCLLRCDAASPCPEELSSACVDLSGTEADGEDSGGLPDWRTRLCLPSCEHDEDCARPGFSCRTAPTPAGEWVSVCMPPHPRPLGQPCRNALGDLSADLCVGSLCLNLGAAGYCSSLCNPGSCPDTADCVRFSGDLGLGEVGVCLQRCTGDRASCQYDALLACEAADSNGDLGFTLAGSAPPAVSGYCAPRRCSALDPGCPVGAQCDVTIGGFCVAESDGE